MAGSSPSDFFSAWCRNFFSFSQGLERWDRFIYDSLTNSSTRPPSENIVIIAIDETSLISFGRWPWPRNIHGDLIDKLSLGGAKVIGFDVVIAEPSQSPENDQLLAEAVARSNLVFMPVLSEMNPATNGLQLTKPIDMIAGNVAGLGHVDSELDSDGMMRRTFLMAGLGSPTWQALSLAMLNFTNPVPIEKLPGRRNDHLASISPDNWIRDYEILLPFAGGPGHFKRISYATFMDPEFDPVIVENRYVLVGTTATGLGDTLPTPVSGESVPMPGVEITANLLDSLAQGLANTIITMGHGLGLTVVAEGVHSHEQLAVLRKQKCDIVQGYYFSYPLPATEITALLKKSPFLLEEENSS